MLVSPSILAADFAKLGDEVTAVLAGGADWIHLDVMDNHYVPNLTIGPMVCQALRKRDANVFLDVHLMVEPVDAMIEQFARAGANLISFHPEASKNVHRSIQLIRASGAQVGIAINPATPVSIISELLSEINLVLLMSVNPGFGGQKFIANTLEKIQQVSHLIATSTSNCSVKYIQVDGGVTAQNVNAVARAGANCVVAGTAIFGEENYAEAILKLKNC